MIPRRGILLGMDDDLLTAKILQKCSERLGFFCEQMAEEVAKIPPTLTAEEFRGVIVNMLKKLAAQYQSMADQDEAEIRRLNR